MRMEGPDDEDVAFDEWFSRRILENLEVSPQITIGFVDTFTEL